MFTLFVLTFLPTQLSVLVRFPSSDCYSSPAVWQNRCALSIVSAISPINGVDGHTFLLTTKFADFAESDCVRMESCPEVGEDCSPSASTRIRLLLSPSRDAGERRRRADRRPCCQRGNGATQPPLAVYRRL